MLQGWVITLVALSYLGLLFAIAYWGDKRAGSGHSLTVNPYIYTLSIAVYCTSWTFYGSVGRAASSGVGFLPIYLGPTLTFLLGWFVLRKIIRISKENRIISIADFIASRYGKSALLGGLVTVIAVIGIMPYISLQLKAVSTSFTMLLQDKESLVVASKAGAGLFSDTALYVSILLGLFAVLFGTRHIDASEHHEGMVIAVAFESVVKLLAFLAVGLFVTYGVFDGFGDLFNKIQSSEKFSHLMTMKGSGGYGAWASLTILAMAAILFLPRQFQVTVVECVDEKHLYKAIWLFPLYLFLINIFVLPIAFGGLLFFGDSGVNADTFVLTLPIAHGNESLALFTFIGGLSAATAMIIVGTVALSTMVSNDLVMPVLLRIRRLRLAQRSDLSGLILIIRRVTIFLVLLLGYLYARLIGDSYALVSIGLVSFTAAAQFAPAIIAGIYFKEVSRAGALAGLAAGFIAWTYTLLLPSFARSGWLPQSFLSEGPFGISLLKPYALFGLSGLDTFSHALFWTMVFNIGLLLLISLFTKQSVIERSQAVQFVDVFRRTGQGQRIWRGRATVGELKALLTRFIGRDRMNNSIAMYLRAHNKLADDAASANGEFVTFVERQLAGAIGAASARIMIASVVREELHDVDEMLEILDDATQIIEYSRQLEEKSRELEAATNELRTVNMRLLELDKLKDGFVSTVSHELRTPLTSIRSFSEIIQDNPDMDPVERAEFLDIIVKESERLTRLIDNVLDIARMEADDVDWELEQIDPGPVIDRALAATSSLFYKGGKTSIHTHIQDNLPSILANEDRLLQVIVNLISNAAKFCDQENGAINLKSWTENGLLHLSVQDNGAGIDPVDHNKVFQRFQQVGDPVTGRPKGSGLGLTICAEIIRRFNGKIWVDSTLGAGATFTFSIPVARSSGH